MESAMKFVGELDFLRRTVELFKHRIEALENNAQEDKKQNSSLFSSLNLGGELNELACKLLLSNNPPPLTALHVRHDAETKAIILAALDKCNWNRRAAAKLLTGRSDSSAYKMLLYLIKKLGVDTSNGA